ncbi:hypothetical protein GWK47_035512 [Chionoecetes opilio]|uniref:Uncharacterized protein n=1 Tax=Chionoecetes opilio TaxID=41210 RepID=A0A8J4YGR6_CHIOP|nr:hypothetical protein GWK47_035512 [Chionoecetes opilio]
MVLSQICIVARGALHTSRVWYWSPAAWAQLTASSTLLTQANNLPTVTVFLDLEKAFELASPTLFSPPSRGRGSGEGLLCLARGLHPAPSVRVKVPRGSNHATRDTGETDAQGGPITQAVSCSNMLWKRIEIALPSPVAPPCFKLRRDMALVVTGRGDRLFHDASSA